MRRATLFTLTLLAAMPALAATERVAVVFESGRGAMLRWPLPNGPLPPAFRVERREGGNRTPVATLQPGVDAAPLSAQDRDLLTRYQRVSAGADANAARLARTFTTLRSIAEPNVARALGIFADDPTVRAGATVTYEVYANDALYATSGALTLTDTPPPAPPAMVLANATREALTLTWEGDASRDANAAAIYLVYRREGSAEPKLVSASPIMASRSAPDEPLRAAFVDPAPAVEKNVAYAVVARDAFGRTGPAGTPVEVLYADFAALDPPRDLKGDVANGAVRLTWTAVRNSNRAGFRVVRALNSNAAGDLLTPAPVTANEFVDATAAPGVTYYYRVSAVNGRGEEGVPSPSVNVQARLARPPAAPSAIESAQAAGRVLLSWTAVPGAVGYRVERELSRGTWGNVGADITRTATFEDRIPLGVGGSLAYRVITIGADGTPSEPSKPVTVALADTKAPLAPVILGVDGAEGKATLRFRADGRANETAGLLVLRSSNRHDVGTIVHAAPLPPNATSYTDTDVLAGTTYFYRLIAVDATGNRSDPSSPAASVTVGAPPIAAPAAPRARYETTPFAHVSFSFPVAPQSVRYVIQRQDGTEWLQIAGPLTADALTAIDTRPPRGPAVYRLVAVPTSGGEGVASPAVTVNVP